MFHAIATAADTNALIPEPRLFCPGYYHIGWGDALLLSKR